jgi:bifunctional non-homologous end joining protein LigD
MEPIAKSQVLKGDFIHQIKWDGIRGICVMENDAVSVFTKKGRNATAAYPELAVVTRQLDAKQAVLDGEMVVFADGKPSFYHALKRSRIHRPAVAAHYAVRYIIFDLLMLDGEDLRRTPIEHRQALLKQRFTDSAIAALADSFDDGEALFALMKQKNMEGIVSKRRGSLYTAGKTHNDWFKTKTVKKMLCAVIGVHFNEGQAASLILGIYREGELVSVGHVGTGLSQSDLRRLGEYAMREGKAAGKQDRLVEPRLTCWVRFAEWTPTLTLRHPVMLGFADSKPEQAAGEELSL